MSPRPDRTVVGPLSVRAEECACPFRGDRASTPSRWRTSKGSQSAGSDRGQPSPAGSQAGLHPGRPRPRSAKCRRKGHGLRSVLFGTNGTATSWIALIALRPNVTRLWRYCSSTTRDVSNDQESVGAWSATSSSIVVFGQSAFCPQAPPEIYWLGTPVGDYLLTIHADSILAPFALEKLSMMATQTGTAIVCSAELGHDASETITSPVGTYVPGLFAKAGSARDFCCLPQVFARVSISGRRRRRHRRR